MKTLLAIAAVWLLIACAIGPIAGRLLRGRRK